MNSDMIALKPFSPKAARHLCALIDIEDKRMREVVEALLDEDEAADKCNDLAELHSLKHRLETETVSEVTLKEYQCLAQLLIQGIASYHERLEQKPGEDEEADLSNDIGFLIAILSDLRKSTAWYTVLTRL